MSFDSRKRQRERQWVKELYDEGSPSGESYSPPRGFSVHRSYPIIKSNTGKPTYLQLKWAIEVIKLWANGVATKRVPTYPSEEVATKQKGGFAGEQKNTDASSKSQEGEACKTVAHLPSVQARHRDAPARRKKRKRTPRIRA